MLEFDQSDGKLFIQSLLSLVSSESPALVFKSVRLLFRHFSKTEELLNKLSQIQLLVSSQDVENYNNIKDGIDGIHQVLESNLKKLKM